MPTSAPEAHDPAPPGTPAPALSSLPEAAHEPPDAPTSPPHRRGLVALLALVSLASLAGAAAFYLRSRPAAPSFRTAQVALADITERVTATGTLQPVITSPVGAQVSGIVWKLHADYNSLVKAGQLLVELDPALFQNAVAQATAQVAQAEASLAASRSATLGAKNARDRTLKLAGDSLAGTAEVDAALAAFGQADGQARAGAAQVALARAQLARARLDLLHSTLRSPVDGTVISRNVDVGQAVAATLTAPTLFTIAQDLTHLQVHAAVDEADIGQIRPGQAVTFTVDAFREDVFRAVVREVRNAPQTAQNVVTYDVVIDTDNPSLKLRPGMTASVSILIVQKTRVTAVPNEALRFRPTARAGAAAPGRPRTAAAGGAVYVPQGAEATRIAVKVGVTDGSMTEVSGVEVGREVVIDVNRDKSKAPAVAAAGGPGRGF